MIIIHNHNHEHLHSHIHTEYASSRKKRFIITILANLFMSILEVIGGIISGSFSLLSDSIHNLNDTFAIFLSFLAHKISEKPKNSVKTYGYKRFNILTALFNSVSLIVICCFLIMESIKKFFNSTHLDSDTMLIIAIVGIAGNLIGVILLREDSESSLNTKSAYLHLLSDSMSSVAVIICGFIIKFTGFYILDPIIAICISLYIIYESIQTAKQTVDILSQSTPKNINTNKIVEKIKEIDNIKDIHHIHIWALDEHDINFEAHVVVDKNISIEETDKKIIKIKELLSDFGITHTTIQFEYNCDNETC